MLDDERVRLTEITTAAHARELLESLPSGTTIRESAQMALQQWADVGVTTRDQIAAMKNVDLRPSDFTHYDRDVRLFACEARGDLHAEGVLLPAAFEWRQHSDLITEADRITPPHELQDGTPWDQLSAPEQWAYLDGCGAAYDAVQHVRQVAARSGQQWRHLTMSDRGPRADGIVPAEGYTDQMWRARRAGYHDLTMRALSDATLETAPAGRA